MGIRGCQTGNQGGVKRGIRGCQTRNQGGVKRGIGVTTVNTLKEPKLHLRRLIMHRGMLILYVLVLKQYVRVCIVLIRNHAGVYNLVNLQQIVLIFFSHVPFSQSKWTFSKCYSITTDRKYVQRSMYVRGVVSVVIAYILFITTRKQLPSADNNIKIRR